MYHIPSANPVRLGREGGREGGRERGGGQGRESSFLRCKHPLQSKVQRVIRFIHIHELKNISLSVVPLLMERSYRSVPNGVLTAHMEGY